jgi:anti-sigma B factor antagonist
MDDIVASDWSDNAPSSEDLEVTRREVSEGVLICVAGELDLLSAPAFSARLESEITHTEGAVILDLGEVTFMSSAGINALLRAGDLAGPRLRLRAMNHSVRRVLELTSLLDRFPIVTEDGDMRERRPPGG